MVTIFLCIAVAWHNWKIPLMSLHLHLFPPRLNSALCFVICNFFGRKKKNKGLGPTSWSRFSNERLRHDSLQLPTHAVSGGYRQNKAGKVKLVSRKSTCLLWCPLLTVCVNTQADWWWPRHTWMWCDEGSNNLGRVAEDSNICNYLSITKFYLWKFWLFAWNLTSFNLPLKIGYGKASDRQNDLLLSYFYRKK